MIEIAYYNNMIRKIYYNNCDLFIEKKAKENKEFIEYETTLDKKTINHYQNYSEVNNLNVKEKPKR